MVFNRLKKAKLWIKQRKCKFFQTKVNYLGHEIENGSIRPGKEKVEALFQYKRPATLKQLLGFLGLANYFRKFIKNYSHIASPLLNLTKKVSAPLWTNECQDSFDKIRTILSSEDGVLRLPDLDKVFIIECDASDLGVGGVLLQDQPDGSRLPITYFSKSLSSAQKNYSVSERELLAIVLTIEHNKHYFFAKEFLILSDHQPIKWLMSCKNPASRLARWIIRLEEYSFKIEYKTGKSNGAADGLSRMVDKNNTINSEYEDIIINVIIVSFVRLSDRMIKWYPEPIVSIQNSIISKMNTSAINRELDNTFSNQLINNITISINKSQFTKQSNENEFIFNLICIDQIKVQQQDLKFVKTFKHKSKIIVNAIMFRQVDSPIEQLSDNNIEWIYKYLLNKQKPPLNEATNNERRAFQINSNH